MECALPRIVLAALSRPPTRTPLVTLPCSWQPSVTLPLPPLLCPALAINAVWSPLVIMPSPLVTLLCPLFSAPPSPAVLHSHPKSSCSIPLVILPPPWSSCPPIPPCSATRWPQLDATPVGPATAVLLLQLPGDPEQWGQRCRGNASGRQTAGWREHCRWGCGRVVMVGGAFGGR